MGKRQGLAFLMAFFMGIMSALSYVPDAEAAGAVYVLVSSKNNLSTTTYKYNGKGLITERATTGGNGETVQYKYDKKTNHMTDMVWNIGREQANYHFNYNKKGQRIQTISNLYGSTAIGYSYDKKHRLSQELWAVNSIPNWLTAAYTYNEKSQIVSYSEKYSDGYMDSVQILSYDKRGNLKQVQYGDGTINYKNTYKDGRLVKRENGGEVTTFKYKKVYVTGKLAERIKKQQNKLINDRIPGFIN